MNEDVVRPQIHHIHHSLLTPTMPAFTAMVLIQTTKAQLHCALQSPAVRLYTNFREDTQPQFWHGSQPHNAHKACMILYWSYIILRGRSKTTVYPVSLSMCQLPDISIILLNYIAWHVAPNSFSPLLLEHSGSKTLSRVQAGYQPGIQRLGQRSQKILSQAKKKSRDMMIWWDPEPWND